MRSARAVTVTDPRSDLRRNAVVRLGNVIKLTALEDRILERLVWHAVGIVTNGQLLKEVRGPHQSDVRALRVHVAILEAQPRAASRAAKIHRHGVKDRVPTRDGSGHKGPSRLASGRR